MVDISKISVDIGDGLTLEHTLLRAGSPRLLVTIPGRGYLNSHPLLHYLTLIGTQRGYDVLQVRYSFQVFPRVQVSLPDFMTDTRAAIRAALDQNHYTHLCIAGKSLGSPLAASLINEMAVDDKRLILLTPVQSAAQLAGIVRTLAIVGTADPAYNAAEVRDDARRPNIQWHVYPDLNHSLEYEADWRGSLRVLDEIMGLCEAFLA